jgi:para-nitrobenzyl esterase
MKSRSFFACVFGVFLLLAGAALRADDNLVPVTLENFIRAETDLYFGRKAAGDSFGKLNHQREMADIDHQDVVRMNRDTIYSSGVFDLEASGGSGDKVTP